MLFKEISPIQKYKKTNSDEAKTKYIKYRNKLKTILIKAEKSFYNKDASKFIPEEEYEAVFTCPPYYNIEIYNKKSFLDLNDFN